MSLPDALRASLRLPAICAPMKDVSGPALVIAAARAGIMAALPYHNASGADEFEDWLAAIERELAPLRAEGHRVGPLAVNIGRIDERDEARVRRACARAGIGVFISSFGDPTVPVQRAHDHGALAFHDVTSMRFAGKAIAAGADGLIAIGAGGGGHSGTISPLVFVPLLRRMFAGTIVLAGAVSTGAAIRAAQVLGADLAYLGTRFIASEEALAGQAYKADIVAGGIDDLVYSANPTGVPANWLRAGLSRAGLDPEHMPPRRDRLGSAHLPEGVMPWSTIGSAGQGMALIDDAPDVARIVERLLAEYDEARAIP